MMLAPVKRIAKFFAPVEQTAIFAGMRNKEIRLERLRQLVHELGSPEEVATRSGVSAEYLKQLLKRTESESGNPRNVGDTLAARLEVGCGKPAGWMDRPLADDPVKQEREAEAERVLNLFERLPLGSRALAVAMLRTIGEQPVAEMPSKLSSVPNTGRAYGRRETDLHVDLKIPTEQGWHDERNQSDAAPGNARNEGTGKTSRHVAKR